MKAVIDAVFAEGAMLVAVLADVCLIIGVMGPAWSRPREANATQIDTLSLWKTCNKPSPNGYVNCWDLPTMPSWFLAVQALMTTCPVGLLLSFLVVTLFTCDCSSRLKEDRRLLLVYCSITTVFSVLGLTGLVVFGTRLGSLRLTIEGAQNATWRTSWSFGMTTLGVGANFLSVVLVIVELIIGPRRKEAPPDTMPVIADAADMATSSHMSVALETVA